MPDTVMNESRPAPLVLDKLAAALCKAQSEMSGASKETTNPHFNRKYADLASVWNTIREPLTKNGLSVVQLLRSVQGGVEVETILLHTSGQQISDVFGVPASKSDAQGYGSAATYARRYSLMAMVGVAPEDDDGNAAGEGHKAGAAGSAGGGGEFRPNRRQMPAGGGQGQALSTAIREGERDGLTQNAPPKGTLPGKDAAPAAASAIKKIEWVKKSAEMLKTMNAPAARVWWKSEAERIAVIETGLPTEYERLLDAYNEALERPVELA